MKSAFWRSLAVVALVAMPAMANANDASIGSETAHAAMQGATLMNTTAIFNAFPHLVAMNGNGVELDVDDGSGSGKFWYEAYDGTWLNFTVGRNDLGLQGTNFMWGGDNFAPFITPEFFFGGTNNGVSPFMDAMWVNIGVARPTAAGGAWAANIQFAMGKNTDEDTGAGTEDTNDTSGFGAQVSWGNGDGLHLSGEFATQSDKYEPAGTTDYDIGVTDFGVNARYDSDMYIYQGNFVWISGSEDVSQNDLTAMGAMFSAGRYVRNEVDGQATVEFGLQWLNQKLEDAAGDEDKFNSFAIPTMKVAAWQQISNRFGLMGGVDWAYFIQSDESDADQEKFTDNYSDFDWSVGLYFQPNDVVRIDAQLREDNLNNLLSLGNQEELITYIGATVGLN